MARTAPAFAGVVGGAPHVSLLPRSEVARRERESLTRQWFWVVFAAIIVAALAIGGAYAYNLYAQQQLAAEQARTNSLLMKVGSLSDVSRTLAAEKELENFRADAMGNDFAWRPVLARVQTTLPAGVVLTGFAVTSGAAPVKDAGPAKDAASGTGTAATRGAAPTGGTAASGAPATGLSGTITFESSTPLESGPLIRKLRSVKGIASVDGSSLTESAQVKGAMVYTLDIAFDQSIYTGAYAAGGQ